VDSGHVDPVRDPSGATGGEPSGAAAERPRGGLSDARAPDNTERPRGGLSDARAPENAQLSPCRAREVLQRVGDKWSMYVIDLLGQGTMRFSELHRSIDGITARMLTVTLRGLERDGIVTRTIHPVIPPRVEYDLTPMGQTLLNTIGQLVTWADSHLPEISAAQVAYDARHPAE
jgi:DNA-binding HxlR family transcriptional regulator